MYKFKLRTYFDGRIPLVIYRKGRTVYFQLQHQLVGVDRYCGGAFCEYDKITTDNNSEIGRMAQKLLDRFHEISDFYPRQLDEMLAENRDEFLNPDADMVNFFEAKDFKEIESKYDKCNIHYSIPNEKYTFTLWWYKKGQRGNCSDSTGEPGILTFDTSLEFTDYSDAEALGAMITEALDRSRKISDRIAGNPYPEKTIELLNESKLTVQAPRDKHFIDEEDNGVCELYQLYGYYPREDSEERSAGFYLGIAAELDCDMNEENIRNAWEKLHGKAEFFEVKPVEYGIFKLRAEMKNKSVHRVSYLLQIDECELLDCTMELRKPNSRKKLDEKLSELFEEFANKCKFNA